MSTERTLMSWTRTSLALIGFGFTLYEFFGAFQDATAGAGAARPEAPRNVGLLFIGLGVFAILLATWNHYALLRYLKSDKFKAVAGAEGLPIWSLTSAVGIILALIGTGVFVWILFRG